MDEAEDSKCQTMKDTRKRRTFSNDQVVGINKATDARVCWMNAALKKKTKELKLTWITWSETVETHLEFFFIFENRINRSLFQVCRRDIDWAKFRNTCGGTFKNTTLEGKPAAPALKWRETRWVCCRRKTLGFIRQRSCSKLELGFLWRRSLDSAQTGWCNNVRLKHLAGFGCAQLARFIETAPERGNVPEKRLLGSFSAFGFVHP